MSFLFLKTLLVFFFPFLLFVEWNNVKLLRLDFVRFVNGFGSLNGEKKKLEKIVQFREDIPVPLRFTIAYLNH